jgi:hypothetical protein
MSTNAVRERETERKRGLPIVKRRRKEDRSSICLTLSFVLLLTMSAEAVVRRKPRVLLMCTGSVATVKAIELINRISDFAEV